MCLLKHSTDLIPYISGLPHLLNKVFLTFSTRPSLTIWSSTAYLSPSLCPLPYFFLAYYILFGILFTHLLINYCLFSPDTRTSAPQGTYTTEAYPAPRQCIALSRYSIDIFSNFKNRYNSHIIKLTPLKSTIQCFFSIFIELWNHYYCPISDHFHQPKKKLHIH